MTTEPAAGPLARRHGAQPTDLACARALEVASTRVEHGRFLLVSTNAVGRPNLERRLVAVTLADQAAAALAGDALSAGRTSRPTNGRAAGDGTVDSRRS